MNEFETRVCNKRDTDANWTTANPVLLDGEMVVVRMSDGSIRSKTGDGITAYTLLPFNSGAPIDEEELNAMLREVLV